MKISFIDIQNFRRLKACRIEISEKETLFVGANNSGKTTAMNALIYFLKEDKQFTTREFTLSNWAAINKIGNDWVEAANDPDNKKADLTIGIWEDYLPQIDVWIDVKEDEVYHVTKLLPSLGWTGGLLGVRLRFEPRDLVTLYQEFTEYFLKASNTKNSSADHKDLKLWPHSLMDFFESKLNTHFSISAYKLDPAKNISFQKLSTNSVPLDNKPFKGLIKVNSIDAQRGFSDVNTENQNHGRLSSQLSDYYAKHLDPKENPSPSDLEVIKSIESSKNEFDSRLKNSFGPSFKELEGLNYPGLGSPRISISTKVNPINNIEHESAITYQLNDEESNHDVKLFLPEKYNGLGYQNYISMAFKLIRFRDEWMKVGKSATRNNLPEGEEEFELIHLVLIEEPEAHLHPQAQQVFIAKAYEILRNNSFILKADSPFSTQLIVSTHSSHIVHKVDFNCLRYFKREFAKDTVSIPTSKVVNLSEVFGKKTVTAEEETRKFAIRYLKTTHCDIFFADAVIMVEGPAERMLLPHFIQNNFKDLAISHITILEIGGSHAHTLKPLIERLGVFTLIITDLDSIEQKAHPTTGNITWPKVPPSRGKGFKTGNDTLKTWIPKKDLLDEVLDATASEKCSSDLSIRVAYQFPLKIQFNGNKVEAIPYTFEDALVFENLTLFNTTSGTGLIKKLREAILNTTSSIEVASKEMFDAIDKGDKAKFALDVMYSIDPVELKVPGYIDEGLKWLQEKLQIVNKSSVK